MDRITSGWDLSWVDEWAVYRCSPQKTIRVTEEINGLGFTAWVPVAIKEMRLPRKKASAKLEFCMLPSFVFVEHAKEAIEALDSEILMGLLQLRRMEINGNPVSCDRESMRGLFESHNKVLSESADLFSPGEMVYVSSGPFAHYDGEILERSGDHYKVAIKDSNVLIKIAPFLLRKKRA